MSDYAGLGSLVAEIKEASRNIELGDAETNKKLAAFEKSLNELWLRTGRPGREWHSDDDIERKDAIGLCQVKHDLTIPANDGTRKAEYFPSSSEIDEALTARKAIQTLFRHGDPNRLDPTYRKSLSSFQFGTNSYLLPPQMSNTVLRCIVDPTDVLNLFNTVNISAASIKFPIDNSRMNEAAWACEQNCFANNPQLDLQEGLGELEIKPETLRMVACAGTDMIQDASFDIANWILEKVSQAFRAAINNSVLLGDGLGKPLGILHPRAGVPICETSPATPPSQFSWQDLLMLRFEIPLQWQAGASYLMNQRTFALLVTMSDAQSRPLWAQLPEGMPGFQIAGAPIRIVSQMPDIAPGSTPIAYGNWRQCYTIVNRRATTMVPDPYTAGWCMLYRFDARLGGSVTCPNAARLLRIR